MKKLAGTCWGVDTLVLKKLYVECIHPVVEYGMNSSCTAAKCNTERPTGSKIRPYTGAVHSTSISALETTSGLQSLENRINIKALSQAAKFKRLTDQPMHSQMSKPTKGRLKRSSFIHYTRLLETQQPELLDCMPEPIQTHAAVPCSERQKFPAILTSIQGIDRKAAQSNPERRSITVRHISANCPEEEWTQVHIHASAIEATRDGGGGFYIKYRAEEARNMAAARRYATKFRAEAMVRNTAATEILANLAKTHPWKLFSSLMTF